MVYVNFSITKPFSCKIFTTLTSKNPLKTLEEKLTDKIQLSIILKSDFLSKLCFVQVAVKNKSEFPV